MLLKLKLRIHPHDELNKDSEIVFEAAKLSFDESLTFRGDGHAGIPNWIQYPDIPLCPKSGKRMRFLAQFHAGVKASRSNVEPADEFYRHYFEELNFWGDGDLFIFFEPSSKSRLLFYTEHVVDSNPNKILILSTKRLTKSAGIFLSCQLALTLNYGVVF